VVGLPSSSASVPVVFNCLECPQRESLSVRQMARLKAQSAYTGMESEIDEVPGQV
jgi:hypothetical protein